VWNCKSDVPKTLFQLVVVASLRANEVANCDQLDLEHLDHGLLLWVVLWCSLLETTEVVAHRTKSALNKVIGLLLFERFGRSVDTAKLSLALAVGSWSLFGRTRSVHISTDLAPYLWRAVALRVLRTAIDTASVVAMLLAMGLRRSILITMPGAVVTTLVVLSAVRTILRMSALAIAVCPMYRSVGFAGNNLAHRT
jgi:hypothetical protein